MVNALGLEPGDPLIKRGAYSLSSPVGLFRKCPQWVER